MNMGLRGELHPQLGAELERLLGLSPAVAGLCILVTALVTLDAFNNTFLGADTLNNPSNNVAFAAAGRGTVSVHLTRMVSGATLHVILYRQQDRRAPA